MILSKLHFPKARNEKKCCIWLTSWAMLWIETHPKVVDSLLVTLPSFTRASSQIDHYSITILLPSSPTTSSFSSFYSLPQFMSLPICFLTAFDSPPFLTDCFPSLNPCSCFPLYNPSTFPASALFLTTHSFNIPFLLFELSDSHLSICKSIPLVIQRGSNKSHLL